jgi:hypothetical protein
LWQYFKVLFYCVLYTNVYKRSILYSISRNKSGKNKGENKMAWWNRQYQYTLYGPTGVDHRDEGEQPSGPWWYGAVHFRETKMPWWAREAMAALPAADFCEAGFSAPKTLSPEGQEIFDCVTANACPRCEGSGYKGGRFAFSVEAKRDDWKPCLACAGTGQRK